MDGGHYACVLAYLDGLEYLKLAINSEDAEDQGWWAAWAARTLNRAANYLATSNVGRAPGFEPRPEYAPERLMSAIQQFYHQALAMIPAEHFHLRFGGGFLCLKPLYPA